MYNIKDIELRMLHIGELNLLRFGSKWLNLQRFGHFEPNLSRFNPPIRNIRNSISLKLYIFGNLIHYTFEIYPIQSSF